MIERIRIICPPQLFVSVLLVYVVVTVLLYAVRPWTAELALWQVTLVVVPVAVVVIQKVAMPVVSRAVRRRCDLAAPEASGNAGPGASAAERAQRDD